MRTDGEMPLPLPKWHPRHVPLAALREGYFTFASTRKGAMAGFGTNLRGKRHARAYRNAHVDQNKVPNNLLVNEPSLSTQGIGGSCGR